MTTLKHGQIVQIHWSAHRKYKVKIRVGNKIYKKTDRWHNLRTWLSEYKLPAKNVKYLPSIIYRMNPHTGQRRIHLLTVSAGLTRYKFYETEPNGSLVNERFECYKSFQGVEMFVDSDALFPAILLYMVDDMRNEDIKLDFARNNWVINHYNNLVNFKEVAMLFADSIYKDIDTHVPALPSAPYDLPL